MFSSAHPSDTGFSGRAAADLSLNQDLLKNVKILKNLA